MTRCKMGDSGLRGQSGRAIEVTAGVHAILAGATEIVHCVKSSPRKDYNVVSCLGEETGVLMEQSLRQESDLSLNPEIL